MTCLKKIQNTEVFGSKFSSRTLTTAGDISDYSFKAVVKNIIQGKILEISGIKNAGTINFDFSQLQTLKKSTYQIEYWGDFGALGNEPFLLEELSIVSAENATNCANSDNLNFEIKVEEISIPVSISKVINNFSLNIDNLTPEQIALMKGEKGDKGDKGDAGQQGIQGIQGEKGEKGDAGEKGDKGDKGDNGATGLQGIQGIQGVKGDKGEKGEKGDAFTYADFTPTQIAELQKPATDKVIELNQLETTLTNSESIRVQNENTRVSSENTRNTNEIDRSSSENSRQENEVSRQENEVSRQENENERILAETERNDNESVRISSENTRITSENTRNTNEQTRINAENNRVSAETSRVNSENTRVTAETERIANENLRKTAENARVSAENSRSTAETSRANAETTRGNAENTRISNENTRVTSENTRVSNESSRVTAESSRVTAENARVAAELERQNNKPFNVKVTTPSSWVTGTLSETEIYRFSIPANTISSQSILSIESMLFNKIGVNGNFNVRVKLTTSATMPTGSTEQIARSPNVTANVRVTAIRRKFYVNGDVIKSQGFDSGLYFDEVNNTDVISTRTLDRTQTYNVIISVTLYNVSDQVRLEGLDFNIK